MTNYVLPTKLVQKIIFFSKSTLTNTLFCFQPGKSANAAGQKSENRHKKRVRQPHNTTEKQR